MSDYFDRDIWDQLTRDSSPTTMVQRRIIPESPHNVYLAESRPVRKRVMRLELESELSSEPSVQPQGLGFKTSVEVTSQGTNFVLEAASPNDNVLFAELSNDLVGVLLTSDPVACADRIFNRIVAWQSFFSKAKDPFTPERAAGLFAELWVLNESVFPVLGSVSGSLSWHGPDPALQDFQYPRFAIEVKSFRGTGPGALRISSEHQLELVGVGTLFVAYVRLSQRAVGEGITLGDLIDAVRVAVGASEVGASYFEAQLLTVGWHDSFRDMRSEVFEIRSLEYFEVDDDFPRVISTMLPTGVHSTKYKVDRSALDPFLADEAKLATMLGEANGAQD